MSDSVKTRRALPTRRGPLASARRTLRVDGEDLVRAGSPIAGPGSPVLVEAARNDVRLAEWIRGRRDRVFEQLHRYGAVLFRGFPQSGPEALEGALQALHGSELLSYDYRSTPRSRVAGRVYTSTDYPPDRVIPQHSEQAYSRAFPMTLGFLCLTAARAGGATPIADNRRVLARIPDATRARFEKHGVAYVRNYGGPLDLGWREVFQTEDPTEVERYCASQGIDLEWGEADRLTTRQVCQAVFAHPATGEAAWFNQAHLFHVSSLAEADRASLLELCGGEAGLSRQAYFGNGDSICEAELQVIREAIEAEKTRFDWRAGDLMLVDNVLASHGREAFEGDRRVVVGMAGAAGWTAESTP